MAQIIFKRNSEVNTLEPKLVIGYMNDDGDEFEKELDFGCGEDLQNYMKAVIKEDYEYFFNESELRNFRITDCWIKGVTISGKTEKGRLTVHVIDNYVQGSCIVNDDVLKDENADKIKEIQEIIKR
jgi:hypothetical protein